jgi:hypothetical protein
MPWPAGKHIRAAAMFMREIAIAVQETAGKLAHPARFELTTSAFGEPNTTAVFCWFRKELPDQAPWGSLWA